MSQLTLQVIQIGSDFAAVYLHNKLLNVIRQAQFMLEASETNSTSLAWNQLDIQNLPVCWEAIVVHEITRVFLWSRVDEWHYRLIGERAEAETEVLRQIRERLREAASHLHQRLFVVFHRPREVHQVIQIQGIVSRRLVIHSN